MTASFLVDTDTIVSLCRTSAVNRSQAVFEYGPIKFPPVYPALHGAGKDCACKKPNMLRYSTTLSRKTVHCMIRCHVCYIPVYLNPCNWTNVATNCVIEL
jgi:hypothetical protein